MVCWTTSMARPAGPVGILSLSHFEAPHVVGPKELSYLLEIIPEDMRATFQTPSELHRFEPSKFASEEAAVVASRDAFSKAGLLPSAIDYVVATSFVAHWQQWFPAFGSYIHRALALGPHVPVLNIQSQCTSFADGLLAAWMLVRSGTARKVLVVAATEGLNEGDPSDPVAAWAGDGAAAAIVSDERLQAEFIGYDYFSVGQIHRDYRMRLRDRAFPDAVPANAVGDAYGFWAVRDLDALLKWMGKDFAIMLRDGLERAVKAAGLAPKDLDMIFFHQMGPREQVVLLRAGQMLGIDQSVFRDTFDQFGCAGNVDGPITMSLLRQRGEIEAGAVTMLHASGVGGANTALVMRWN
jgi:3-oxoacyl-[acyl-carrier-protein] synthase III